MIVYKWRHKPTGLYYQPVRSSGGTKTNLSKDGKLYHKKYDLTESTSNMHIAVNGSQLKIVKELNHHIFTYTYTHQRYIQTNEREWELVEYELFEKQSNNEQLKCEICNDTNDIIIICNDCLIDKCADRI